MNTSLPTHAAVTAAVGIEPAAEMREARGDGAAPWDDPGTGRRGDLRGRVASDRAVRQTGSGRGPKSGPWVRVFFSSKKPSMSIIAINASHILRLCSVGGTLVMTGPK